MPVAGGDVDRVHGRGLDADPDLAAGRLGDRQVGDIQDSGLPYTTITAFMSHDDKVVTLS